MRAIAIVGPTASGKSDLAIELSRRLGGEIVSCDSMQIYRRLDIGTAKPTEEEMEGIAHHMIDIADPTAPYSAADYAAEAREVIGQILGRGRIPILCGGTGLYLEALRSGRHANAPGADEAFRAALFEEAEREGGASALHARLTEIDPEAAAGIHPNNVRRVIRALELAHLTGSTKSALDAESRRGGDGVELLIFCLCFEDRALLVDRIERRVDRMMERGLLAEVTALYGDGCLAPGQTAEQAIGYRQLIPYLEGKISCETAVADIKTATRRYAKRQMTWFRRTEGIRFLAVDGGGRLRSRSELADEILPQITDWYNT